MVFVFNNISVNVPINGYKAFEKKIEEAPNQLIVFKEQYSTFIRYELETWVEA